MKFLTEANGSKLTDTYSTKPHYYNVASVDPPKTSPYYFMLFKITPCYCMFVYRGHRTISQSGSWSNLIHSKQQLWSSGFQYFGIIRFQNNLFRDDNGSGKSFKSH